MPTPAAPQWSKIVFDLLTGPRALFFSLLFVVFLSVPVYAHEDWLKSHNMYEFVHPYHAWTMAIFWFAVSVLIVSILRWLGILIWSGTKAVVGKHRKRKYLVRMPMDQWALVSRYAQQDKISLPFSAHSGTIRDLERRGIVYQAGVFLSPVGTFPFALHDDVVRFFSPKGFLKLSAERNKIEAKRDR